MFARITCAWHTYTSCIVGLWNGWSISCHSICNCHHIALHRENKRIMSPICRKNSINKLYATHTGKSMLRIDICFCFCLFFSLWCRLFVLCIVIFIHSSIHSRHTYRLLWWVLFYALRYEWNEVVFVHTGIDGILIHFCPISRFHWRSALIMSIFYSSVTQFFLMNCNNSMCEWILKASNNNADRSSKNMALKLSEYECIYFWNRASTRI